MADKLVIIMANTDPANGEELGAPIFQATVAAAMVPSCVPFDLVRATGVYPLPKDAKPLPTAKVTKRFLVSLLSFGLL